MRYELTPLSEIAFKYGSDKCPQLGHHSYTDYYFHLLSKQRKGIRKVLEIGMGTGKTAGAALRMWRDFFPYAYIYGTTTNQESLIKEKRIKTFLSDHTNPDDLKKLIETIGSDIDLVIENATDDPNEQVVTCLNLMPLLNKKTTYIIEDVPDPTILNKLSRYDRHIPNVGHNVRKPNNTLIVVTRKKMEKVSIIIPSCNEKYEVKPGMTVLQRTVQDIYEKATGEIEVIVGFNGPPYQKLPELPNLKVVALPENVGVKILINVLAATATGKYILKTDAHCMFGPGFDEILQEDMEDNWIVTPRFYVLDAKKWQWQDERFYDYFYLSCPFTDPRGFRFKAGGHWPQRTQERAGKPEFEIDETPQIHASAWFVNKDFFFNSIGGYLNIDPMGHAQESPYLCLKTWLGPWGGRVMVNKKTWYAHLHQDGPAKGYRYTRRQEAVSYEIYAKYWMADRWPQRVHNIDWFIEKFSPMPTWPENWREQLIQWQKEAR